MKRAHERARSLVQAALATVVLVGWPSLCLACSVCNDPKNRDSQDAFLDMTIFLSLFPLALIGGIGLWVWRRAKLADALDGPSDAH